MIVPTSLGLLYPSFPKREHSKVAGIWAGVAAVAAAAGPTIGGLLVRVDWRLIFLINMPIGVATIVARPAILPEIRAAARARGCLTRSRSVALRREPRAAPSPPCRGSAWGWGGARRSACSQVAAAAGRRRSGGRRPPARADRASLFPAGSSPRRRRAVPVLPRVRRLAARRPALPGGRVALQRAPDGAGDRPRAGHGGGFRDQRRADHRAGSAAVLPAITGTLLFAAGRRILAARTGRRHPDYAAASCPA